MDTIAEKSPGHKSANCQNDSNKYFQFIHQQYNIQNLYMFKNLIIECLY